MDCGLQKLPGWLEIRASNELISPTCHNQPLETRRATQHLVRPIVSSLEILDGRQAGKEKPLKGAGCAAIATCTPLLPVPTPPAGTLSEPALLSHQARASADANPCNSIDFNGPTPITPAEHLALH